MKQAKLGEAEAKQEVPQCRGVVTVSSDISLTQPRISARLSLDWLCSYVCGVVFIGAIMGSGSAIPLSWGHEVHKGGETELSTRKKVPLRALCSLCP